MKPTSRVPLSSNGIWSGATMGPLRLWTPTHPGLLTDLDQADYFKG